jgi:hypothetical protein
MQSPEMNGGRECKWSAELGTMYSRITGHSVGCEGIYKLEDLKDSRSLFQLLEKVWKWHFF